MAAAVGCSSRLSLLKSIPSLSTAIPLPLRFFFPNQNRNLDYLNPLILCEFRMPARLSYHAAPSSMTSSLVVDGGASTACAAPASFELRLQPFITNRRCELFLSELPSLAELVTHDGTVVIVGAEPSSVRLRRVSGTAPTTGTSLLLFAAPPASFFTVGALCLDGDRKFTGCYTRPEGLHGHLQVAPQHYLLIYLGQFSQVFGDRLPGEDVRDIDVISAIEFDKNGDHLAVGDRGGRVVIFQDIGGKDDLVQSTPRNELEKLDRVVSKHPKFQYKTEFQSHEPEFDYLRSVEIEEKIN